METVKVLVNKWCKVEMLKQVKRLDSNLFTSLEV